MQMELPNFLGNIVYHGCVDISQTFSDATVSIHTFSARGFTAHVLSFAVSCKCYCAVVHTETITKIAILGIDLTYFWHCTKHLGILICNLTREMI